MDTSVNSNGTEAERGADGLDRFPLRTTECTFSAGGTSLTFYKPADPEAVLAAITDEEYARSERLPYWAEIWPATYVLLPFCLKLLHGRSVRICELGAGLGFISAALTGIGLHPFAMEIMYQGCRYCRANMLRNAPHGTVASVVCADWNVTPFKTGFDIIIGADIVYEFKLVDPIVRFIQRHLAPGGRALLADPQRRPWALFKDTCMQQKLSCTTLYQAAVNDGKTCVEIAAVTHEAV